MVKKPPAKTKLPGAFGRFMKDFPEVFQGYEAMGKAAHAGGPLDAKMRDLVKLGMSIGARLEGATHSHARKALAAGARMLPCCLSPPSRMSLTRGVMKDIVRCK